MTTINTLGDIVRKHAAARPRHPALYYHDDARRWTYAELHSESSRVGNALRAEGVGSQDRIAYLARNTPEYYLYLFGGAKLNAVSVAVNWRLAPPEMAHILDDSEAKVLLVGDEFLEQLSAMSLSQLRRVVVLGDPGDSGYPSFEQWIAGHADADPAQPANPENSCYQLYTSGTTGLPKGVELSHANVVHSVGVGHGPVGMRADSVNLVCMPLFHIAGSGWGLVGLHAGASTVMLRDVDLHAILEIIPAHRVTHALLVPAVLQFLLDLPETRRTDFASLESLTYGASPITEAVLVDALRTFGCGFFQAYGLTESTGSVCLLEPGDHDPGGPNAALLRSCGRPVPNHTVRILDPETLAELPEGEVGEICVYGPQTMRGYWRNPEATAKALPGDGWLRTGDAGYLQDGYVFIHDRLKDMVISGGENIYPAEIENVLMQHASVVDVAVIGVPSERWGETVKALVVVDAAAAASEQTLIEYCRARLAHYKCPTSVDWVEAIPRNPSGKILKTTLREPYWKQRGRRVS